LNKYNTKLLELLLGNLFRVGAFLNCGLNLFHDLIVEGKKEFTNNCNLVNWFLNSVWLRKFNSFSKNHTIKPPKFYIAGCRILNIIHTRLRHRSSSLNADLFRVHLANDPGCICGCAFEDAIHFILECCLYNKAREELKLRLVFLYELKKLWT
jgi:hypothetical protein